MQTDTSSSTLPNPEDETRSALAELVDMANTRAALGGISKQSVYRLVADGELNVVKIRRRTFFRRCDIEQFIDRAAS